MYIIFDIRCVKANMEEDMPFREKVAWISLLTTLLVWGAYFGHMALTRGSLPNAVYFSGFLAAVLVQILLTVIASIAVAAMAPRDAAAGLDERDRAIERGSVTVAYPILIVLLLGVAASVHLGVQAIGMAYGILGAIVVAEIVHFGAQIAGYRWGR
jgi:hypothetical protein